MRIEYVNLQDPSKSFISDSDIDANKPLVDVQGTSSAGYPRKNWKIKFKSAGFDMTELGTHESKYKLRDDSIPESTFTFKTDFAESSGVHNTGLAAYYEAAWRAMNLKVPPQEANPNIRTTVDGFPILIFHQLTPSSERVFMGKFNFNNDKTEATFGFKAGMVSWETKNNTSDRILFKSANFDAVDEEGNLLFLNDYEDRYPDDKYSNPYKIKRFTEWVMSCDRNIEEGTGVNIAKFREEQPLYFDLNSFLFFYIMTEFTAAVDQRGKNMFLTWYGTEEEGDDICYLLFYDNDTVFGINNVGKIQFGYEVEYHDKYGNAPAWNSETSRLWNIFEEAFAEEIKAFYMEIRQKPFKLTDTYGILSYDALRLFLDTNHSSLWSEAIYNEDGRFKYLDEKNETYYDNLQGSREEHRKWWISNRQRYMDSKYETGTFISDRVNLRQYTPMENKKRHWFGVEPTGTYDLGVFAHTYGMVNWGGTKRRARAFIGDTLSLTPLEQANYTDTEVYIYGASSYNSLGDLSSKYLGTVDFSAAKKYYRINIR